MFEIDFEKEPAPDPRSAMNQLWIGALAWFEYYIARESPVSESVGDPTAAPKVAPLPDV